jgi:hypothetical protein
MTYSELHEQQFAVLPLCLETISVSGGPVHQQSGLVQHNFNNMVGGDCIGGNCSQSSLKFNLGTVNQSASSSTTMTDMIDMAGGWGSSSSSAWRARANGKGGTGGSGAPDGA